VKSSKKNKKNELNDKKDLLGGVIVISLLLLVLVTYIICYDYKKNEKTSEQLNIIDNSLSLINVYEDYTFSKVVDKESIDTTKKIIGTYNCRYDNCDIYNNDLIENIYGDKNIILSENNKVFIYDFVDDKVISGLYDDIIIQLEDSLFVVKNNNQYGIINCDGIEIVSASFDEIDFNNIYYNKLKVKKDNLYGLMDISSGIVLLEPKYEMINIDSDKYYSVFKEGFWYILDGNENFLTNGYSYTFAFNKGFIAVVDNNLKILKYSKEHEELLNEVVIPIYDVEEGFKVYKNSSYIYIEVYNNEETIKYEYNVNRNNLKNK